MEWIWSILELEPTTDRSAIRQAYARKANDCHPDEDSEELLRLKQALQAAFDYAKANGRSSGPAFGNEAEPNGTRWPAIAEPPEMGENPFRGGEAIRQFEALYTGRQRKNSKLWMEYVTQRRVFRRSLGPAFYRSSLRNGNRGGTAAQQGIHSVALCRLPADGPLG